MKDFLEIIVVFIAGLLFVVLKPLLVALIYAIPAFGLQYFGLNGLVIGLAISFLICAACVAGPSESENGPTCLKCGGTARVTASTDTHKGYRCR